MNANLLEAINDAYDFGTAVAKAGCDFINDNELAVAHSQITDFIGEAAAMMKSAADAGDQRSFQIANMAVARLTQDYARAQSDGRDAVIALGRETAATTRQIISGTGCKYVH